MSSKNTRGSEWRKWDLHFHTPASYDYKDKSVTEKQIVDTLISKGVSVVAITDHHTMDVPRIRKLQNIAGDELTVLPGIELRSDVLGRPSIHYIGIFPENCNLEYVWTKLQNEVNDVEFNKKGGNEGFFVNIEKMSNLIHELGGLVSIHAGKKSNSIDRELSHENEYLMQLKKETAYHADIFEVGREEDQAGYREKVFPKIERTFPMILCSDNHDIKNYHVKANLWIKAEPTFEGLKQILHEPNHRVHIGEYPPFDPPIYIPGIILDFPDDTTVGDKKDPFCLRGKRHELSFSLNYTCIIGGRGTGKSTVLNLLAQKLDTKGPKKLKYPIQVNGQTVIDECVQIESKALGIDPEYVSQNEIEKFAKNTDELTISLIDRLAQRDSIKNLEKYKNEVGNNDKVFSYLLESNTQLRELKNNLDSAKKKLSTTQNIQSTYSSEEYKQLIETDRDIADALRRMQRSQDRFFKLRASLTEISQDFRVTDDEVSNKYDTSFKEMINDLNALLKRYSSIDFSEEENEVKNISSVKIKIENNIRSYLEERGVSSENLNRLSGISEETGKLRQQIQEYEEKISGLEKERAEYSNYESVAKITKEQYEQTLQGLIKEANDRLGQIGSKYVKSICLEYKFSFEQAREKLYEQFRQEFKSEITSYGVKQNSYLSDIFKECVDIEKVLNDAHEISFRQKLAGYSSNAQAKQFLIELFSSDENYKRLRTLCQRNYYNPVEFAVIEVTYDGHSLRDTSFGQRCTAVLILLLLLGNNPIIIDEPEAHLDSLLISNYLVKLIKEQKKHRQIIFATHNANFVINGDAELIYVLEEGENGTTITPTTIENKEHKDKLIALEGGKEAFFRREQRY